MSKYRITLDGKTYEMEIECIDEAVPIKNEPKEESGSVLQKQKDNNINSVSGKIARSPMPGTITKIMSKQGEQVNQGQPILILEAMKMENEITAPMSGKIVSLSVKIGDSVQGGTTLFEIGE